jgi:hypothetical protein
MQTKFRFRKQKEIFTIGQISFRIEFKFKARGKKIKTFPSETSNTNLFFLQM